ncbi:hypothetical protein [Actinomyces procaprae]|uniref:hypothetical protein n=1 Tax=Actinomyces procaprae TaxID=2560010 RepID=UPI0010A2772D|nr:hypothetical protein [Actinomyces procaprae]
MAAAAAVLLICVAALVLRRPAGLGDEPGIAMTPSAAETAQMERSVGPVMTPRASTAGADSTGDTGGDAPEVVQQAPPQAVNPQGSNGAGSSGAGTSRGGDVDDDDDVDDVDDDDDDDKDDD